MNDHATVACTTKTKTTRLVRNKPTKRYPTNTLTGFYNIIGSNNSGKEKEDVKHLPDARLFR